MKGGVNMEIELNAKAIFDYCKTMLAMDKYMDTELEKQIIEEICFMINTDWDWYGCIKTLSTRIDSRVANLVLMWYGLWEYLKAWGDICFPLPPHVSGFFS